MSLRKSNNYLNGEKLFFVYWVEMGGPQEYGGAGSQGKLQSWCRANKIFHPLTGRVPNRMGVWKSMWRWAVMNFDESYEIAQRGVSQYGQFITRERWVEEINQHVKTAFQNTKSAEKWKVKNVL